ncbi:MAG: adenosylmethionine decarboxylase [Candidatus Lokiarchaeota archaeon]|nr:adenosylmethionine decarboxylase [Candidatus Lokiarchaeota archaeon]
MDSETEEKLTVIANKARLAEGIEGIRSILLTMYRFPSLKNKKVAQKTGIAIPALAAARGELVKAGIIADKTFLGEQGKVWVRKNLNLTYDYDPFLDEFDFTLDDIPEDFLYLKEIETYLKDRPKAEYALDQSHANLLTILKRTFYLLKKGDIEGRKIIFLGDDDATSIAVALTGLAKEITVLDVDERILDFLSTVILQKSLKNINVVHHDLRNPCPTDIQNNYDIVIMDPPYTNEGLRLFLKRAREVLKSSLKIDAKIYPIIGKKCFLCFGNKPPKETLNVQLSILDHGFILKEMLPNFNHYKGASIIGQFSHLYYLQSVITTSTPFNYNYESHPIYTSELKKGRDLSFRPIGYHFTGEMRFNSKDLLMDNKVIFQAFQESLTSAELAIIDIYNHNYHPYGYSVVAILETSHAAVHTWPEHGYVSIDFFICDEFQKGLKALNILKRKLNPKITKFFYIERGKESKESYNPIEIRG